MTKTDMKVLFANVKKLQSEKDKLSNQMLGVDSKLSDQIKVIKDELGSGPFQVNDQLVTIRFRAEKDSEGKKLETGTYYFVRMGSKEVTVID